MAISEDREPTWALVCWVEQYPLICGGIHLPADRPWFWWDGALSMSDNDYFVECPCGTHVYMNRCKAKGNQWLYIGQCTCRGECIIFTYRDR